MLPNHLRLGSTRATVPEGTLDWNGAGLMILPEESLLALKFLYICNRLIVALSRALLTPFRPSVFLSWFILWDKKSEYCVLASVSARIGNKGKSHLWPDLLKPSFRPIF